MFVRVKFKTSAVYNGVLYTAGQIATLWLDERALQMRKKDFDVLSTSKMTTARNKKKSNDVETTDNGAD